MTKAQEKAVERLRALVDKDCKSLSEEVKTFDVKDYDHFVSVYIVLGYEGDEKTMAFLARDHAHLFIGKRGGITFPVNSKKGNQYCLPFKGYSILQAVCKQRRMFY